MGHGGDQHHTDRSQQQVAHCRFQSHTNKRPISNRRRHGQLAHQSQFDHRPGARRFHQRDSDCGGHRHRVLQTGSTADQQLHEACGHVFSKRELGDTSSKTGQHRIHQHEVQLARAAVLGTCA